MYNLEDFVVERNRSGYYVLNHSKNEYFNKKGVSEIWNSSNSKSYYFDREEDAKKALSKFIYSQKVSNKEDIPDGVYHTYYPESGRTYINNIKDNIINEYVFLKSKKYIRGDFEALNKSEHTPATPLQIELLEKSREADKYVNLSKYEIGEEVKCLESTKGFILGKTYKIKDILIGEEIVLEFESNDLGEVDGWYESKFEEVINQNWYGRENKVVEYATCEDVYDNSGITYLTETKFTTCDDSEISYSATGLPKSLEIDTKTGTINLKPVEKEFMLIKSAKDFDESQGTLKVIRENGLTTYEFTPIIVEKKVIKTVAQKLKKIIFGISVDKV